MNRSAALRRRRPLRFYRDVVASMKITALLFLSLSAFSLNAGAAAPADVSAATSADAPALHPNRDSPAASLERGRIAFEHYCSLCHGKSGEGNGRAARLYTPPPANLTISDKNASYKELIVRGGGAVLGRSAAMPAWNQELTEEQIGDIVNFLQSLVAVQKTAAGNVGATGNSESRVR